MKQIRILLIVVFLSSFCACRKNLLNVPASNLLTTAQAFSTTATVTAYFAGMYRDLPIEDFNFVSGTFWKFEGEGQWTAAWDGETLSNTASQLNGSDFANAYQAIRNVNNFIQVLPTQTQWDAPTQAAWLGEAYFIRAYNYYALAKYYGGVPILKAPQTNPTQALPRNKEEDVWNFVHSDLVAAEAGLPQNGQINATAKLANGYAFGYGHADKNAAYALDARAMVIAAAVAEYGDPNVWAGNGAAASSGTGVNIVGVNPASASTFWTYAYNAANAVIQSGVYSLYMKYPSNLAQNFQYLFYDCKQGDNSTEAIFCRGYDFATTQRTHSNDLCNLPNYIKSTVGYGNMEEPSDDFLEAFDYLDGTPGQWYDGTGTVPVSNFGKGALNTATSPAPAALGLLNNAGGTYHYPTIDGPWNASNPATAHDFRLAGTVVLDGSQFRNSPLPVAGQPGVTSTPQGPALAVSTGVTLAGITGQQGIIWSGDGGIAKPHNGSTYCQYYYESTKSFGTTPPTNPADPIIVGTGNSNVGTNPMFLKKWTDPVTDISLLRDYTSRTSWLDLRYGEVLLNFAEASYELGHANSEAAGAINQLRARAGLAPLTSVTREQIRHERYVESGFESRNFWDQIRWRTLYNNFLSPRVTYGIYVYWDIDTSDYVFEKVANSGRGYNQNSCYYFNLPVGTSNPLLTKNPGF
jgi:hypothetical protein